MTGVQTCALPISSSWRSKVLLKLKEGVKTPSELSRESNLSYSHVSDILSDLMSMKIVVCKTPNLRKGKIYAITKLGEEVLQGV